jgi:membrane dipeptidase
MTRSRKLVWAFIIFLLLSMGVFRILIPLWVAWDKNKITLQPPYQVSSPALRFHQSIKVADLHADSLLWGRNLLEKSSIGHIDLPRLLEANMTLQMFSVVTKTPRGLNINSNAGDSDNITVLALAQGWPWKSIGSLIERALYQARQLQKLSSESNGKLVLVRSQADLRRVLLQSNSQSIVAGLLSLEGAHALEGNVDNLEDLYQAGYRMIGLTHFFDNEIGGSAHGVSKGGLTAFGHEVIIRAESLRMIVDLSHASAQLLDDVLAISTQPVVVSHTGVKGTCNQSRNLTDKQMRAVAATGGLIGIGFYPAAICGNQVKDIVDAFVYARRVVGIRNLALGSDFDGAVSAPFDVTGLPLLTEALMKRGFSNEEIRLIMGENIISLLQNNLPID